MNNLSKILSLENVQLDLEVSSKKRAFEQAGLIFENNCGIARSTVSANLFARERLGSTGLGHGVAVPGTPGQGLENQDVEGTLEEVELLTCHEIPLNGSGEILRGEGLSSRV